MKHIIVISSSLRAHSNSEALAGEFVRGAREAGHQVELVSLKDKDIRFCRGCLACQKSQRCVIHDDAVAIVEKMREADVIAFATPIYYYELAGQLKTLLDRANPLYSGNSRFHAIYLLSAAAENEPETPHGAMHGLEGWIACFEKARFAGSIFAGGVNAPNEILGHEGLRIAYETGKSVR